MTDYVCCSCKEAKPSEAFTARGKGRSGLAAKCRDCTAAYNADYRARNIEAVRAADRLKYHKNPDRKRDYDYRRKYGIGISEYNAMLAEQNFCCAICAEPSAVAPKGRLYVDHCHSSGAVRALLCSHCNTMLGHSKDSPETLMRAAEYLSMARATA